MTEKPRQEGAAIVPFPTSLPESENGGLHVAVCPDGDGWSVHFADDSRQTKSMAPMSKETAIGLGVEAVLIWNASLLVSR